MTVVSAERIRAAARAGISDPATGSARQWQAVQDWLDARADDPWPARWAELAPRVGLTAAQSADPDAVADAVAALLGGDDHDSPRARQVRALLRTWADDDFAADGPLMGAFTSHDTDIEHAVVDVPADEVAAVAAWLTGEEGRPIVVRDATLIGGGFSRRMWRATVDHDTAGRSRGVVVRIEQGGMFATDTEREVAAMRAVLGAGYRVPEVLHVEPTGRVLGQPFMIMGLVDGVARLDEQGLDDVIASVAALHRLPASVLDPRERTAQQVIDDEIDGWLAVYRAHAPHRIPLIEDAAAWLHRHLRPTGPTVIVHGDAGPGNALYHPADGLTVLDWEFAHVGDALEDWAYLALIRGRRIMGPDAWKERIRAVAGVWFDDEQWRTWLAFNHFRGACVNLTAATVFDTAPRPTADQLAIGIAVSERFLVQLAAITAADPD